MARCLTPLGALVLLASNLACHATTTDEGPGAAPDPVPRVALSSAEDVIDDVESTMASDYPVEVADSLSGHSLCTGPQSHLDEVDASLAAIDTRDFDHALQSMSELQRRLYCLGLPGLYAMDYAIGEAIRKSLELPTPERDRAIQALFNPAMLVVDRLMFTRSSYIAALMRVKNAEIAAAMASYPYQDLGMLVLRPATGTLVRLPSNTCTATQCDRTENNMLAMFADGRRFGLGVCNWLSLSHNEFECAAGLLCGELEPVDFEELEPSEGGAPRWKSHGTVAGHESELRYRAPHGDHVIAMSEAAHAVTDGRDPNETQQAVAPLRSLDSLQVALRTSFSESAGLREHLIFGERFTDDDLLGLCGGFLEPVTLPWAEPAYDMFECLLNQRAEHEASVDCIGQGFAELAGEARLIRFATDGSTGVLDPECESNPVADGVGRSYTCEDIPEFCNWDDLDDEDANVDTSETSSQDTKAAARKAAEDARDQAATDPRVAADLGTAKAKEGSMVDTKHAIDKARGVEMRFGPWNFTGQGCQHATACFDQQRNVIWVKESAFADYSQERVLAMIVHEIMHAAMAEMGIPSSKHHDYNQEWGAQVTEFGTASEIVVPVNPHRMPAPDGNECSGFARMMQSVLECIQELHAPGTGSSALEDYVPWEDPTVTYPRPDESPEEIDECLEFLSGGTTGGGSSLSPCNFMHCPDPNDCWCADLGVPAVQLRGLGNNCGAFIDCAPEYELDPVTCMCIPIGGLPDPDVPPNPLGQMWQSIDARLELGVGEDALFRDHAEPPENLFPGEPPQ